MASTEIIAKTLSQVFADSDLGAHLGEEELLSTIEAQLETMTRRQGRVFLQPLWDSMKRRPGVTVALALPPFCKFKKWENHLAIQVDLPVEWAAMDRAAIEQKAAVCRTPTPVAPAAAPVEAANATASQAEEVDATPALVPQFSAVGGAAGPRGMPAAVVFDDTIPAVVSKARSEPMTAPVPVMLPVLPQKQAPERQPAHPAPSALELPQQAAGSGVEPADPSRQPTSPGVAAVDPAREPTHPGLTATPPRRQSTIPGPQTVQPVSSASSGAQTHPGLAAVTGIAPPVVPPLVLQPLVFPANSAAVTPPIRPAMSATAGGLSSDPVLAAMGEFSAAVTDPNRSPTHPAFAAVPPPARLATNPGVGVSPSQIRTVSHPELAAVVAAALREADPDGTFTTVADPAVVTLEGLDPSQPITHALSPPSRQLTNPGLGAVGAPSRQLTNPGLGAAGAPSRQVTYPVLGAAGAPSRQVTYPGLGAAGASTRQVTNPGLAPAASSGSSVAPVESRTSNAPVTSGTRLGRTTSGSGNERAKTSLPPARNKTTTKPGYVPFRGPGKREQKLVTMLCVCVPLFIGSITYAMMATKSSVEIIAPHLLTIDIPLNAVQRQGAGVRACLKDDGWLKQPLEERKTQVLAALRKAKAINVLHITICDSSGGTKAVGTTDPQLGPTAHIFGAAEAVASSGGL
jgi:hypothetical protein